MGYRILNLLVAIDQLLYVVFTLGKGNPDMTISGAAYGYELKGKVTGRVFRPIIDALFFWDKEHCKRSFYVESDRRLTKR